jgi:hyperosmotically inducible protein
MTMRNKLSLLVLGIAVGTGLGWAAPPTTDSQAMQRIESRLDHSKVNQHGNVQVAYTGGVATLTGTVDDLGTKLDAEKAVRKVQGVTQVVNNLEVRPQSDQRILEAARHQVVMYFAYGVFDDIELTAHNGTLTVSGAVTLPFKKTDLGNILTRVKGVSALNNNLEVLPVSTFDDRLRLEVARAIYRDPYFLRYANQALPPIHIIVKNGNVMLLGVVDSSSDRTKAEMDARLAGLSFAIVNNLQVVRT